MCSDKYEPERLPWGYIDLRSHFDTVINLRFEGIEKATDLARASMEKRLDSMNEFRDTLKDQASKFVTRTELLAAVVGISTIISIVISIIVKVIK